MLLSELLRPDLIKIGLDAKNAREAVGELIDLLVERHEIPLSRRQQAVELVLEVEDARASGMEKGIAVPHAVTDSVEDILCALGTAPHGIPFRSPDGLPADVVVLLLLPKHNFVGDVRTLACLERLLEHATLKDAIVAAQTPEAAFALIDREEHR